MRSFNDCFGSFPTVTAGTASGTGNEGADDERSDDDTVASDTSDSADDDYRGRNYTESACPSSLSSTPNNWRRRANHSEPLAPRRTAVLAALLPHRPTPAPRAPRSHMHRGLINPELLPSPAASAQGKGTSTPSMHSSNALPSASLSCAAPSLLMHSPPGTACKRVLRTPR